MAIFIICFFVQWLEMLKASINMVNQFNFLVWLNFLPQYFKICYDIYIKNMKTYPIIKARI